MRKNTNFHARQLQSPFTFITCKNAPSVFYRKKNHAVEKICVNYNPSDVCEWIKHGKESQFLPRHVIPKTTTIIPKICELYCSACVSVLLKDLAIKANQHPSEEFMTTAARRAQAWNACCFKLFLLITPDIQQTNMLCYRVNDTWEWNYDEKVHSGPLCALL